MEHVICRHGVPEQLLSDRGPNFLSELIQHVCEILGVSKINTSGYHQQTDGLVEKFNSTLVNMISKCYEVQKHDWDKLFIPIMLLYFITLRYHTSYTSYSDIGR